jgi:GNAT superfamily N-acetyltransferase
MRTAREDELPELIAFARDHAGSTTSLRTAREWFEARPELFVTRFEDGTLVAEAYGRLARPEEDPTGSSEPAVVLQSIAVAPDRRGEGIGAAVLTFFEERAAKHAETVSAASAGNVEGFYRSCDYEPKLILLQGVEEEPRETSEPPNRLLGQRRTDSGARFLYVGFEEYDPELRSELAVEFGASEANTIYEKQL